MIYTDLTKKAMKLCCEAHKDQTDKSGFPYVHHPLHVAESMPDEITAAVALLHDVAEDTPYTLDDLRAMGFPAAVTDALALMTHDGSVPYLDYVRTLSHDPVARRVKLADLAHNSDLSRLLGRVTDKDRERLARYQQAREILLAAEEEVPYVP